MANDYYRPRATEHTMLHATIASFEYRARRQTVSRGCYCILARNCYSKGKMGGWTDGERAGVKILEKKSLLTEHWAREQCGTVQLLYTAH